MEVGSEPGDQWAYSGGGYTLLQLTIEEPTGQDFADAMAARVLQPLEMTQSSFRLKDIEDRLAPIYDETGTRVAHRHFTAAAAAALYTTPHDMVRFLAAMARPASDGGLLPQSLLAEMASAQAYRFGLPIWGLGTVLYVHGSDKPLVIGHEGGNYPAINTSARLHIESGDGIVVFATGTTDLASHIADDWTYWRTGQVPITALPRYFKTTLLIWIAGVVCLGIVALLCVCRSRRSRRR